MENDKFRINEDGDIIRDRDSRTFSNDIIVKILNIYENQLRNKQRAIDALKKMTDTVEENSKQCLGD